VGVKRVEFATNDGFSYAVQSLRENGVNGVKFGKSFFREKKTLFVDIPEDEIGKLKHDIWWQENLAA